MLLIIIAVLVLVIATLILYARWNFGTLEALGYPVDKPHFLLGNTSQVHKECVHLVDIDRMNRLGPVYGVYEGRQAQVHVCDPDMLKCIMATNADHFNDRRRLDFGSPVMNEMPDFVPPDKWKVIRTMMTPVFTSMKLKNMTGAMVESLEDYFGDWKDDLKKSNGQIEKINLRQEIFTMTTDMIARSLLNMKIDNRRDPNNYFAKQLTNLLQGSQSEPSWLMPLFLSFPVLGLVGPMDNKAADALTKVLKDVIEARRKSGNKERDFLSHMADLMDKLDTPDFKKAKITELTIYCQAVVTFFAGQDQVSDIIAHMVYYMTQSPEVEAKIYEELDAYIKKYGTKFSGENISELTYLNACLQEATRLFGFFIRPERVATKDWKHDKWLIKKGTPVIIPLFALHRNPEYFPNPDKFQPDRFLPENKDKLHPYAFAGFGHGPRSCTGIAFAQKALLLTAVHLFKDFKFLARPETKIEYVPAGLFVALTKPLYFDVVARK